MTPETAAKIARKIGIMCAHIEGTLTDFEFTDPHSGESYIGDILPYLATGDRPLRVIDSWDAAGYDWRVGGRTKDGKVNARVMMLDSDNLWRVLADVWEDTPATAILACAAAMEEGNG